MAAATLPGRDRELGSIDTLIAAAVGERGGTLLVRGDAGIGKSSILLEARARATKLDLTVLSATGVQSEATLPFAGLHQVLRPILAVVDSLPTPQRTALLAAFGMIDAAAPDLFVTALAALNLITEAASRGTGVLVVVDDGQWLDPPSSDVLAFVARRIESDPVALIIALRDRIENRFDASGFAEIHLGRLDETVSMQLLDAAAPQLSRDARKRILEEADGNPLGLVELPSVLTSSGSTGRTGLPEPLVLTARLERAFADRLVDLPAATRSLLTIAAVDDTGSVTEVLAAAADVEGHVVTAAALTPAVEAGFVTIVDADLLFRHPLVRSAIYQDAGLAARRTAHLALASTLTSDPDRRAWHRAAAVLGADDSVAAELEDTAARAQRRGAMAVAVAALERAAMVSETGQRGARLVRAAETAFEVGRRDIVARMLREAASLELGSLERARILLIQEQTDPHLVTEPAGVKSFIDVADRASGDGDLDLAVSLLLVVAQRCWWADPGKESRDLVIRAVDGLGLAHDDPRLVAILAYAAPIERCGDVIGALGCIGADGLGDAVSARLLGNAALNVGAFDLGTAPLASAVGLLRAQGRLGHMARVLTLQAWCSTLTGDWRLAVPAADEAIALASETDEPIWVAGAQAGQSMLAGLRGQYELAEGLADDAERTAGPMRASFILAVVQLARGATALGRGRSSEAYEHLRRVFDGTDSAYHHFVRTWAVGDMTEAAVHSGQADAARAILSELEMLAERTPAAWFAGGIRYGRALLADDEDAEELFQAALEGPVNYPIHRARVLLAYGVWLRRQRRIAESRPPLRAARDLFDTIGAVPWGERARQELRASGEVSGQRDPSAWDQLTPQELQIAEMAAHGLSNREIGEQLYLSHRTVGSHLYRIFPKLGVTSRAQVQDALRSTPSAAPNT